MSALRRRLLIGAVILLLVALVLGALFRVTTERALGRAEAFRFRRMLVTQRGEQGVYRFFYVTNRREREPEGAVEERFSGERAPGLRFGRFDTAIEPSL